MSLYYAQKLLYELNRDKAMQAEYRENPDAVIARFDLNEEEIDAFKREDIGLLYVLGVNGQLLMHYAAFTGLEWTEYISAMREGVFRHGNVRAGLYAMTDGKGAI
jgi:hypothetical protein